MSIRKKNWKTHSGGQPLATSARSGRRRRYVLDVNRTRCPSRVRREPNGMRLGSEEAARIPSPYGSGFPAAAGTICLGAPHAAAKGRAACMTHAKPPLPASLCLAGRRRLPIARHPGGQPTARSARSGQRPRRVHPPTRFGATPRRPAACRSPAAATVAWRCDHAGPSLRGAIFRAGTSLRACFGLREARLEGEPSQVETHLGCVSDLPSLRGPWMAPQA